MKETDMQAVEQVRNAIRVIRKYKRDNRLCGGVRVFIGEDVLPALAACGELVRMLNGTYALDAVPVLVVYGYPKGYVSAE